MQVEVSESTNLQAGLRSGAFPAAVADAVSFNTGMSPEVPQTADVAIIGGGVIGLSVAWRLARRGMAVAVFERSEIGSGASLAATGMLAAAAEHEPGGEALLELALHSQALWPDFNAELERQSGVATDYRAQGTLVVAIGRDEVERLRFRHELQLKCGLNTQWLTGIEARRIEPGLRATVTRAIFCPDDHQVDTRLLVGALWRACVEAGVTIVRNCDVRALATAQGRVSSVETDRGACRAGVVVVASGAWCSELLEPLGLCAPVRPLKGQAIALRPNRQTGTIENVVWTEQIHIAPKSDGRLIVGATVEDAGFNPSITAGGTLALLEGLHRALPSSEEMTLEAIWSGYRPTSEDDAPILGETPIPGLVLAIGHHRNGILLTPATAEAIDELVATGSMKGAAAGFGLSRFGGQKRFAKAF